MPDFNSFTANEYQPIEHYGVIGNLETVALVGLHGSVDFFCFPDFDSPSVFARLLDDENGGFFQIAPTDKNMTCRQLYLPDTNILITRFLSNEGIVEVTDFMPLCPEHSNRQLVRMVKSIQGKADMTMECYPAYDYARSKTTTKRGEDEYGVRFFPDNKTTHAGHLIGSIPIDIKDGGAFARFDLEEGEEICFSYMCDDEDKGFFSPETLHHMQEETSHFWRDWIGQCGYNGLWQDQVKRSALLLKMLFSSEHGSIVAAPTFGLPEAIGGERNWDYRFCWIRDSAFTVYALLKLGFAEEATRYVRWISERYENAGPDGSLQLMYRLDGSTEMDEAELGHMEGYHQSRPVRIGNAAQDQLQLDIYGELIDSIYLANKFSTPVSYRGWKNLCNTIEYVCENWHKPDESIWEFRGGKRHFLHSRLMCWVAVDRALKLAEKGSFPAPIGHWRSIRNDIYKDIHDNFWNEDMQSFVQYKGGNTMDASTLLMPLVKFISPADPRWQSTMNMMQQRLVTDAFVRRYENEKIDFEGLDGHKEDHFTTCSFWYCECLARGGDVEQARLLFEKMIGYANHVGLYSEELGFEGQHLGNFPQAFTHLAMISCALALEKAIDNGGQPF